MKQIFLIVFLITSICFNAQPPQKFYTKFGGNGDDVGYSAKQTLDGHYIIAGSTSSYGNGNTDAYLVKLDSMGQIIWEKTFGGFNNDIGKSVIQLSDSGYVMAGFTNSFGAGGYDAYLVKTDKTGNLVWQSTFGGLDWEFAEDLVLGPDNNIWVVGNTSSFGAGKKDGFVVKFSLAGVQLSQKFIGGVENEEFRSIIRTNDNYLATIGYTESKGDVNGDGYFVKLDLNGDTLFTRTFGGGGKDYANDVVQKNTGNYVMCGAKTYSSNPKTRSYMHTISSTGAFVVDSSRYHSGNIDEQYISAANSVLSGSLTAFIKTIPVPQFSKQGNIFVSEPSGFEYAINSFGGADDEFFYSIESVKRGGYIMTGSTISYNSIGTDIYFIKIDDSVVINYTSIVGVHENIEPEEPVISYLSNHIIRIHFDENSSMKSGELYNLNGQCVKKIGDIENDADLDLSNYSDAVYLLKIRYVNGENRNFKLIKR